MTKRGRRSILKNGVQRGVYLEFAQVKALEKIADETKRSVDHHVRQAIDKYLAEQLLSPQPKVGAA